MRTEISKRLSELFSRQEEPVKTARPGSTHLTLVTDELLAWVASQVPPGTRSVMGVFEQRENGIFLVGIV